MTRQGAYRLCAFLLAWRSPTSWTTPGGAWAGRATGTRRASTPWMHQATTPEQLKDSNGNVLWEVRRAVNAINRINGQTIGTNQSVDYAYDANGTLAMKADALGHATRYTRDALGRVTDIQAPSGGHAQLRYDALDAVVGAAD